MHISISILDNSMPWIWLKNNGALGGPRKAPFHSILNTDTSETVHTFNPTLSVRDKTVTEFQKTIQ